jgi:hypothetical protein
VATQLDALPNEPTRAARGYNAALALDKDRMLRGIIPMLPEVHANAHLDKMQPVLRSVSDSALVHFYLTCGHLITIARGDLGTELPSIVDCWACAAERSGSGGTSAEAER